MGKLAGFLLLGATVAACAQGSQLDIPGGEGGSGAANTAAGSGAGTSGAGASGHGGTSGTASTSGGTGATTGTGASTTTAGNGAGTTTSMTGTGSTTTTSTIGTTTSTIGTTTTTVQPPCSSSCSGCCKNNACQPGLSDQACGVNGQTCIDCSAESLACFNGFCTQ